MEITKERAIELLGDKEWDYIYNGILAKEKQPFIALKWMKEFEDFELLPNAGEDFYNLHFKLKHFSTRVDLASNYKHSLDGWDTYTILNVLPIPPQPKSGKPKEHFFIHSSAPWLHNGSKCYKDGFASEKEAILELVQYGQKIQANQKAEFRVIDTSFNVKITQDFSPIPVEILTVAQCPVDLDAPQEEKDKWYKSL
jgi:hypothetical protein